MLALVSMFLGVLSACDSEPQVVADTVTTPASTTVLTNQEWPVVHSDPAAAVGQRAVLRARVYSVSKVANDLILCAWVDFDSDQLSTVLRVPDTMEGVARDDFVLVEGSIARVAEPVDACEGTAQPEVEVTHLTVTDRVGVRPALRSEQVGQALERQGIRVVLERIEFAAEETRLYFTLENRRDETLTAFATGLVIEVDGSEIPAIIPIGKGIAAPRGRVAPDAIEHGGFQFPPLAPDGPPITVRWRGAQMAPSGEDIGEWTWVVDPSGTVAPAG